MRINAEPIEKERLGHCTFKKPYQRFTDFEIRERNQRLFLAMLLGNNYRSQAKITFNTLEGYKEIFSTIWATTEKFILLKGGTVIPLEAISDVELQ